MGGFFAELDSRIPLPVSADDHRAETQQLSCETDQPVSIGSDFFHDVNNRLLIIEFACTKLLRGLTSDDVNHSTIVAIDEARQQAADLILQFREAKKKEVLKGSITDLNEIVCQLKPLIRGAAHEDVIVSTELTSSPALVFVRQETVERILLQLILGTLAVNSDGGWLTIQTSHTDGEKNTTSDLSPPISSHFVLLSISDTSCNEVELPTIEEPANGQPSCNALKNGALRRTTLENVGKIVCECGGRIKMTSSEESGSRIDIFLPKMPTIDRPLIPSLDHTQNASGSETVLLVDDDARVRRFIKSALESRGYNVLEADDGCSAINVATEHSDSLHLLVTDLRLGEASGREIADRLRSEYPGLPVVFMSGLVSEELVLDASSTFLEKPFKPADLITVVRRLLDARRMATVSR